MLLPWRSQKAFINLSSLVERLILKKTSLLLSVTLIFRCSTPPPGASLRSALGEPFSWLSDILLEGGGLDDGAVVLAVGTVGVGSVIDVGGVEEDELVTCLGLLGLVGVWDEEEEANDEPDERSGAKGQKQPLKGLENDPGEGLLWLLLGVRVAGLQVAKLSHFEREISFCLVFDEAELVLKKIAVCELMEGEAQVDLPLSFGVSDSCVRARLSGRGCWDEDAG